MVKYDRGDSAYFPTQNLVYDFETDTESLADADTNFPKITITDPEGTVKVDAVSMTNVTTGKYDYSYEILSDAETGIWTGYIDTENSGVPNRRYISFEVI